MWQRDHCALTHAIRIRIRVRIGIGFSSLAARPPYKNSPLPFRNLPFQTTNQDLYEPSITFMPSMASPLSIARQNLVYCARLAAEAECYQDVVNYMKEVAELGTELSAEERSLLINGYKHLIEARRLSLHWLESSGERCGRPSELRVEQRKEYCSKVKSELESICNEVLELMDKYLIPSSTIMETKMLYCKLKGDYFRYIAEVNCGPKREEFANVAMKFYKDASDQAEKRPTPAALGALLNLSILYFDVLKYPHRALQLAQETFYDNVSNLKTVKTEHIEDCTQILVLLGDNIKLWASQVSL